MVLYTWLSKGLENWRFFASDGTPNSYRTLIAGGVAGILWPVVLVPLDC